MGSLWKEFFLVNRQSGNIMQYLNHNYCNLLKDTVDTESEEAEKSSWDQANRGDKLWFGEIERKLPKLSMTTITYRSSS